jgi:hypothetical protein
MSIVKWYGNGRGPKFPWVCTYRKNPAPAQQQCQKFDVYLLENYFAYVY